MSVKDRNPVFNLQNKTHNNPSIDLVNINAYTNFDHILSVCSQNIVQTISLF